MNSLIEQDESLSVQSVDELGDRIVAAAGRIAAATSAWLLLVAEFDRREGYASYGLASTAQWLSWACGLSHRTAVEHVRVARGLAEHPRLASEMSEGRLSFSHVRAITRVAQPGGEELVESLIMAAQHGTVGHVENLVQGLRTVRAADEEQPAPPDYLRHSWNPAGQLQLSARLDPEAGAILTTALDTIARTDELAPAEALAQMAELALAAINDRATPPRTLRGEERAAIVIHVDADRLATEDDAATEDTGGTTSAPRSRERGTAIGRIAHGPGLPRPVIERLLCSGRIRTAITSTDPAGRCSVLDLGRSHRVVTERQYKALLLRDRGCAHPGCRRRHGLQAHHVTHWIRGGRTNLNNLVLLCRRHHHLLHDGAFTITANRRGRFDFHRTDGQPLPEHIDSSQLLHQVQAVSDAHSNVDPNAARTQWDGQRLDHHYAISALAS